MLTAIALGVLALPPAAPAASPPPSSPVAASAAQQTSSPPPSPPVRFVWDDHPSFRAGSRLRVDFIGKFQWDARQPGDDPLLFKTTQMQRARVGVEGRVLRYFEFAVERELTEREVETSNADHPWKDVYVDVHYTDLAQVRLGRFKVPFGLDQLTGIMNLDFVYRSLGASYLAPARDTGAMVHGDVTNKVNYAVGLFAHDGDNARSGRIAGGDVTGAGRLTVAPFRRQGRSLLDQLEIGSALALTSLSDEGELPNGLRGRTAMSHYVFFEPMFVKGQRRRFEADVDWTWESVGVRAEYTHVSDTRERQGFLDNDLADARARSWYVSGAYVVTGERKNRPVNPRGELGRGGAGALEVVGRFERIWFDSAGGEDDAFRHPRADRILPSGNRLLTLGANWYLNKLAKVQLQTIRERLEDPERAPLPAGTPFWSGMLRLQFAL